MQDDDKKFILWDKRDGTGSPGLDGDGSIVSDGVVGRVEISNAYLTSYGSYPDDKRPSDLEIGDCIENVTYSLSGSLGEYDIYRVK
jgi:hypothetical protein